MIYINLAFVVINTYIAATAENRFAIVINAVGAALNLLVVVLHLAR
jgi:hypothetical protein